MIKRFPAILKRNVVWSYATLALLCLCALPVGVSAIARGYETDDTNLKPGMVVSLNQGQEDDGSATVERASQDRPQAVIGVAVRPDDSLITASDGNQPVYVESGGEADAFVTDLNGEIKRGDLLGLSPLKGILMKVSSASPAFAIAIEDIEAAEFRQYQASGGDGLRSVNVALGRVSLDQKAINNLIIEKSDSSLERLGRAITGKDVGEIRVVIALAIFFIVMIAEGGIIYGAISSSILSLGRNPLAKQIIKRELIRVLLVVITVLAFGIAAIYAVLWI